MAHIALVDDESSILTSVSLALESEGFTVDTYTNGVEALVGLENKKYDLGLFDVVSSKIYLFLLDSRLLDLGLSQRCRHQNY